MADNDDTIAKVIPLRGRRCALCGKPADQTYRPFCSKRCADLDLGKWLGGDYRVPTNERPGDDEFADQDGDDGEPR